MPYDLLRITCPACKGHQTVTVRHPSGNPELETDGPCPTCRGRGTKIVDADDVDAIITSASAVLDLAVLISVRDPRNMPGDKVLAMRDSLRNVGAEF